MSKLVLSIVLFLLSFFSLALVDYSGPSEAPSVRPGKKMKRASKTKSMRKVTRSGGRAASSGRSSNVGMSLRSQYDSLEVESIKGRSKFSLIHLNGTFQTPYSLFLDFSYFGVTDEEGLLTQSRGVKSGNPEVILGLNWLRFGKAEEVATVDFLVGGSFAGSSELASSRTDRIAGLETSKRFYIFALALGLQVRMTGSPQLVTETDIGGIQILNASLGVVVGPDIRFSLETGAVKVSKSDDLLRESRLMKEVSYGYITPKLSLSLTPLIGIDLGAVFQTRRVKKTEQDDLLQARLWSLPGAYGNSIFAGLKISL